MAQTYSTVGAYLFGTRVRLQDLIPPYRYEDMHIVAALNTALSDAQRVRPDFFLDLKYQNRLAPGDTDDGAPPYYSTDDLVYLSDGVTVNPIAGTYVPVP